MKNLLQAKDDAHQREVKKQEREQLLSRERITSLEDEAKVLRSSLTQSAMTQSETTCRKSDLSEIQSLSGTVYYHVIVNVFTLCFSEEIVKLKKDYSERSQDLLVAQGQVLVMENSKKRSEDIISDLRKQMEALRHEK